MQSEQMVSTFTEVKEKIFPILQIPFTNVAYITVRTASASRNKNVDKIIHELHIQAGDHSTFVSIDERDLENLVDFSTSYS